MNNKPFSVWGFNASRIEDGNVVRWKEELEDGTRYVEICVRSQEEFDKAVDRFSLMVKKTWPLL